MAIGTVLVVLFIAGLVWVIHGVMNSKDQKPSRSVQTVTMVRPPPPPDEPPPPPPPETKIDEPIPQNEPDPTPDNSPAPTPQLGLDAEGGAGGDAFGLAARKGGSDLVGTGGAAFAWYTSKVKDAIRDCLASDPKLKSKKFTGSVRTSIGADGRLEVKSAGGTGNRDVDTELASYLERCRVSEAPPLELPQPVTLRVVQQL